MLLGSYRSSVFLLVMKRLEHKVDVYSVRFCLSKMKAIKSVQAIETKEI